MELTNLADFLDASGARYRIFDLGRRVVPLPEDDFRRCAEGERPYPYPLQRQAWLGILFWQDQPYVWFVRLGLDEQGLINQGQAAQFMAQVLAAMQEGRDALPDNPFTFLPSEEKRAAFHSQAKLLLGEPASLYYEETLAYARGQLRDWQRLGLQGLADLVARDKDQPWFPGFVAEAPLEVLIPLAMQLENHKLAPELAEALWERLPQAPLPLGRALGRTGKAAEVADKLLAEAALQDLLVVAGRLWESLEDEKRLGHFLELAAALEEGRHFPALFADLVMLPSLRPKLLAKLRDPERSVALAKALGSLF
ncbi:DUF3549 family protein [Gallaecimonas kandeliae]|uniref:DUF3549 family protein n=1 Tax=Gallaecimonas kandeliae TaxID=3029055 RepID=UPI00264940C8|nr:DUF3549 family protein [Gallaecimonas kandeliae]WKE64535.1 DUF3549 family protein [Gallaecimonas kandeliae]